MMDAISTAVFGDGARSRPSRRSIAKKSDGSARNRTNEFAAAKRGMDSIRASFYSSTGRLPNANRSDATRRNYNLIGGSGDRHLCPLDLWIEREISRTLRERSSLFDGMIQTWAAETIQKGFRLKPDTGDDGLNSKIKDALFGWDGDGGWMSECDSRGMMHFWEFMTLAEETELTDGYHAIYLDPTGNNGRGSISIIEADRILTPIGITLKPGYTISHGIVMNPAGYPISVFVADESPEYAMSTTANGQFYPIFRPWRADQGGVVLSISLKRYSATVRQPWLSSAVRPHDEIDDVFTAVRVLMRNAACRATFTQIKDWNAYREWLTLAVGVEAPAPETALTHSPEPGDHVNLNPGEEGGIYETNAPGENFDPFMQLQMNMLGLPLGMCIEEACRIFQKSFAASRMAVDGTRRRYERRQPTIKRRKVTPCLQFAIARLQTVGVLPVDPRCNMIRCGFPGWPYMEPLKDAQAGEIIINSKVASRETLRTEVGYDSDLEEARIKREATLYPDAAAPAPRTINNIDAGGGN